MSDYLKQRDGAPAGFFEAEAAGLRWLAEPAVVPVVELLDHDGEHLRLARLVDGRPTAESARAFGAGLARLHDAGAPAFGWAPSGTAWFGPLTDPFTVPANSHDDFATYWAEDRLRPLLERAAGHLGAEGVAEVEAAIGVIRAGAYSGISGRGTETPSRVHGDLWAGNIMWPDTVGTLIDPAAHGGHRLEDLALLSLFGAPHLIEILDGYAEQHPMPADWRDDLPAHLFFALLAHVVLFGGGYVAESIRTARQIVTRARQLR
ncbi:MAG TPA: fructosamine kinase family protein [Candidatus Avipropionibacterium avicola]|uniref:Fructosamine kinase family protein n=1 Tax=Candidatus Avipropionibacterium avicola TaxID=2840701 RepID=A0A9D1KMS6_9ACTN|nr:fructosamine kinase family protein [Candidatus Avipropionibacterium avicola]